MTVSSIVGQHVADALRNYADVPATPMGPDITPETFATATPDRLAYALAWVVANQIVARRFAESAIDVIPVFHPDNGWDRFVIGRRFSGAAFKYQPANEFGMIVVSSDDGPHLTTPGGKVRLKLGTALRDDAQGAIEAVLARVPNPALEPGTLTARELLPRYPLYYETLTGLIVRHPGLVVAREIFIDDQAIDGAYHPLFLHAAELTPDGEAGQNQARLSHNWFQIQHGEIFAFLDKRGTRAIYRTDHGTWSRVRRQIADEPAERVVERIAGWMRLDGYVPDPAAD